MEDSKIVIEIERLVKAQDEVQLVQPYELQCGKAFDYRIKCDQYGRTLGDMLTPPRPAKLQVSTLTSFIDAINAGVIGGACGPSENGKQYFPNDRIIHVEDYLNVSVKSPSTDIYGVRDTLLTATHKPIEAFTFDTYYSDPPKFIIALQVEFLETEELLWLIRVASNLKAGNTVSIQDDGFSQTVTLKTGEVSTAEVKVKPRIKLIPIRTFAEAAPVQSEFLIRFKQTPDQTPSIALFNVDGTKWQGETMQSIKNYLAKNLPEGTPILA